MKLADYVIEYLRDIGIDRAFIVYGAATGDLIDAFSRVKGIDYVAVMHEQAGSFAAEVTAKVTGELGCFIATSGPGGINVLNGIANCYYDSTPAIFITGQINSKFLKPCNEVRQVGFQENDIVGMAKPITKMAKQIEFPETIKYFLDMAVHVAMSRRPGPVLIDIPINLQKAEVDPESMWSYEMPAEVPNGPVIEAQIEEFISDFSKSERPVMLVGGGVWPSKAVLDVRQLGIELGVPCFPTWNACDVITSDYENYGGRVGTFGGPGRNFAIQNSDLLLAIGSRISGRITGGYVESFARAAKKYIVDIDKTLLMYQEVKGDVNIRCDARLFIRRLLQRIHAEKLQSKSEWLAKAIEWRDKYKPCLEKYFDEKRYIHPYVFIKTLSEELETLDVVTVDTGGDTVVTFQTFETKFGQRLFSSNGNATMGFSFAGAMGACFLIDKRPIIPGGKTIKRVICLIGDGGFNMNIQELRTIKNYNLPLKTFVMNNHSYGITRQFQYTNYEGRYLASGPDGYSPPDFCRIAEAYDVQSYSIHSPDRLREDIRAVLNYEGPIVCDVDMGMHSRYDPRIFGWKTPIEDMYPYLSREEFRSNMFIEPVEGWENPAMPGKSEGTGLA